MVTTNFKHEEHSLDPRDINLVSYNKVTKRFVSEASDLKGAGIEPEFVREVLFQGYVIWLYSAKFDKYVLYRESKAKQVRDGEGDIVADVYVPHFGSISNEKELRLMESALGTELHILND